MSETNPYQVAESISVRTTEDRPQEPTFLDELSRVVMMLLLGLGVWITVIGALFFAIYWSVTLIWG